MIDLYPTLAPLGPGLQIEITSRLSTALADRYRIERRLGVLGLTICLNNPQLGTLKWGKA